MNCFIGYFCKKRKEGIFTSHETALGLQFIIPAKHILIPVGAEQDSKNVLGLQSHLHASMSKCLTDHPRGSDLRPINVFSTLSMAAAHGASFTSITQFLPYVLLTIYKTSKSLNSSISLLWR